jgi:serine/threonine-protein kinase
MARVTSPRVVRALDAGLHRGTPYLAQEYIDGIDLAELDRRRRISLGVGLPLWFVCEVMMQTCRALHAAHQTGVIHRDVKPSNLFVSPASGIRLGDFGIAVAHSEVAQGDTTGTPRFMAPELFRGVPPDRRTDAYGAGATACDLRYGRPPFVTVDDIVDLSRPASFPPPSSPAEAYFQRVLASMLDKDPAARARDVGDPGRHFTLLTQSLRPHAGRRPFVHVSKNEYRLGACTIVLSVGDIATASADALVNSANYRMDMRSGCADALRRAGGDAIEGEAMSLGDRPLGECVATSAGALAARHVLHAVSAWNEVSCVGRAFYRALLLADELGHHSLAVPALGTGKGRVSIEMCANAMMTTLKWHVALGGTRLARIDIVLADEAKLSDFRDVAEEALHDERALSWSDVGLPVEEAVVRGDAATHLNPSTMR